MLLISSNAAARSAAGRLRSGPVDWGEIAFGGQPRPATAAASGGDFVDWSEIREAAVCLASAVGHM